MINQMLDVFARLRALSEHAWALSQDPMFWLIVAVVVIWMLLWALSRSGPKGVMAFRNEKGHVVVARKALEELVRSSCYGVVGIDKIQSTIHFRSKGLSITLRLRLENGYRLSDIATRLQDQMSYALREELGIENLGPIHIIVSGVKRVPLPQSPESLARRLSTMDRLRESEEFVDPKTRL